MIEIIHPENKDHWLTLRSQDVTSTEVSCLFGCSPYSTEFELWHRKKNSQTVKLEPTERMKWGTRLQSAIASGVAEDEKIEIREMTEYIRDTELKIGSSFDFAVGDSGILEVKNVDAAQFKDGWVVDGENIEAPAHIELQVQHQLLISGRRFAKIAALVGGNKVIILNREPNTRIFSIIKDKVSSFWKSIENSTPPTPNFERDSEFISSLYQSVQEGKVIDAVSNPDIWRMAQEYKIYADEEKMAKLKKDGIKAKILTTIGDAEKVLGDGFSISASKIAATQISYERAEYRNFKLSWRKPKL